MQDKYIEDSLTSISMLQTPRSVYPPSDLLVKPRTRKESYIRMTHFSTLYSSAISIYLDDKLISSNLEFGEQSLYQTVRPGSHRITVYSSEEDDPILERSINIPTV